MLLGKYSSRFENVWCSVQNLAQSGRLWTIGARLAQVGMKPDVNHLTELLRQCDTLVLAPNCAHKEMVEQSEEFIRAAKSANIKTLIVCSVLGADEDTNTSKMFKKIEDHAKQSGIETICVVRSGLFQQTLFWFMDTIKTKHELHLPWKGEQAKVALLNLDDLGIFVTSCCATEDMRSLDKQLYRLTGPELVTGTFTHLIHSTYSHR